MQLSQNESKYHKYIKIKTCAFSPTMYTNHNEYVNSTWWLVAMLNFSHYDISLLLHSQAERKKSNLALIFQTDQKPWQYTLIQNGYCRPSCISSIWRTLQMSTMDFVILLNFLQILMCYKALYHKISLEVFSYLLMYSVYINVISLLFSLLLMYSVYFT